MIRINLLVAPKAKRKGGGNASAMPSMEVGNVGSPLVKVLAVVLIAGAGNYAYYSSLNKEAKNIATKMAAAEQKNRELADVKAPVPRAAASGGWLQEAGGCNRPVAGRPGGVRST